MSWHCSKPGCGYEAETFARLGSHARAEHPESITGRPKKVKPGMNGNGAKLGSSPITRVQWKNPLVGLHPRIHYRYETWQQHGYKGSFETWMDEATSIVTELAGYVPAGYYVEEKSDDQRDEGTDEPR